MFGGMAVSKFGKMIGSYRRMQGVSQEELAKHLGISAAAVSKWEREISTPDIDMLCKLADFFGVTVDRLLGRDQKQLVDISFENQMEADRYYAALLLLKVCKIARNQGLLATEGCVKEETGETFLRFAVGYLLDGLQKGMALEDSKEYLIRFAECEKDSRTAKMISETLVLIFAGENESVLKEFLRSYLGRKYIHLIPADEEELRWQMEREEAIHYYSEREYHFSDTNLLQELSNKEDQMIQLILRGVEGETLANALLGASRECRKKVLRNLSDRFIHVIGEQMIYAHVSQEDVIRSQKVILEILQSLEE